MPHEGVSACVFGPGGFRNVTHEISRLRHDAAWLNTLRANTAPTYTPIASSSLDFWLSG
jgi:hypothetical protein